VFLLFDAADVLTREGCRFSAGGLESYGEDTMESAAELRKFPWRKIYHTGYYDRYSQSDIAHHRNAEVIVPDRLDLAALRYIYCRSEAEKETLLCLLPRSLRHGYKDRIASTARMTLFYRQHTFVDSVRLTQDRIVFRFSPETQSPGPFDLILSLEADGRVDSRSMREFLVTSVNAMLEVPFRRPVPRYSARLELDGHLVYAGSYAPIEAPF
jgi:hypothetical protein